MLTKNDIIDAVLKSEGGYVNDPKDLGGETNFGITLAAAVKRKKELAASFGWNGTMRNLTLPMARYIYDMDYWAPIRLDDIYLISPILADRLFDISVNQGVKTAGTFLQRVLNLLNREQKDYTDIAVDGAVGPKTIAVFKEFYRVRGDAGMKSLTLAILGMQLYRYIEITEARPANEAFMLGWLNRVKANMAVTVNYILK